MEKVQDSAIYSKKMCEKLKIKDLYGKDYEIKNFEKIFETYK